MRVFVTGATGFIGSAVVCELLNAGHTVVGLARSDEAAASLRAAGAEVQRGALDDLDSLRAGAAAAEGVMHLAYIHDWSARSGYADAAQADRIAIEALGEALLGSDRPFVVSSGTAAVTAPGRLATEEDAASSDSPRLSERAALAFATRGVRVSALRLPPTVHGSGDKGFVPRLISIAREKGVSGYAGDGSNRWPAVHRLDAARLYRLALEGAPAGTHVHAVGDEGVPLRQIAEVIGRHLNLPVAAIPDERLDEHFGWFARMVRIDNPTSSALTRQRFGWQPARPGLIADLAEGHYFES